MRYVLHILSTFSSLFVALITTGGYLVLGIFLTLEGLPIIGSFIPGHVMIIAAGFLAKLGILNLWVVIVVCTLATVVGDVIGFLLGKKFGYSVLYKFGKFFRVREEYIHKTVEKTKSTIDTHVGKTIVFGKFSPITRPFTPFLVGASGVHIRTFWFYNIIGGMLWVIVSVLLGYVFGASYHAAAGYFGKLMVSAVIAIVFIIWGFRLANRRFHVFKKYEIFVLILNVLSLWALAKTIQDSFSAHSFMSNFDVTANLFVVKHVSAQVVQFAVWMSDLLAPDRLMVLGVAIGLIFLVMKKPRRGLIMIFSVYFTFTIVPMMKELFMRVRPSDAILIISDPSFPSGHAALAGAFFVALAYVYVPKIKSLVVREIFIVLCVIGAILIGLCRIILNVHWVSDVVAGWALGVFVATLSVLFVRYLSGLFVKGNK